MNLANDRHPRRLAIVLLMIGALDVGYFAVARGHVHLPTIAWTKSRISAGLGHSS